MNRTYNNNIRNSRAYSGNYFTEAQISITERFLEIISFILNAIYNFVTDEAVALIAKLTVCFVSITGMFILTGLSVTGLLPFVTAFFSSLGLLVLTLLTFRSIV